MARLPAHAPLALASSARAFLASRMRRRIQETLKVTPKPRFHLRGERVVREVRLGRWGTAINSRAILRAESLGLGRPCGRLSSSRLRFAHSVTTRSAPEKPVRLNRRQSSAPLRHPCDHRRSRRSW